MIIREFTMDDLPEMISIWNEIVEEGNAFPQEEVLTLKTGLDFFNSQSHVGVAFDGEILGLYILHPITWEDAVILPMLAMQYPQKPEENTLVKNWFWIRLKKQKNLIL